MASKWAALKAQYPALPADPTHNEALAVAAEAWSGKPLADIATAYNEARQRKEALEDDLSKQDVTVEALLRVLTDALDAAGLTSIRTEQYSFSTSPEPYPSVKDRPVLRAWAQVHMPDSLALPWQTLASVTKAALESGEPVPPGIEVFIKTKLTRRKA